MCATRSNDARVAPTRAERLRQGARIDRALRLVFSAAPGWTLLGALALLVQSAVPLASLYVVKLLVDDLTARLAPAAEAAPEPTRILVLLGIAFALAVVGIVGQVVLRHANLAQSLLVKDSILRDVQAKSLELDLEFYENADLQDRLYRAQQEAPSRPTRIVQSTTEVARSLLTLAGAGFLLARFHWLVALGVFALALPALAYRLRFARKLFEWRRQRTSDERWSDYYHRLLTTPEHAKEVRLFGFGPAIRARFDERRAALREGTLRISRQRSSRELAVDSVASLAGFAALGLVAWSALRQSITLGEVAMYFGAFQVAQSSLRTLIAQVGEVFENNLFLSTLYEFRQTPSRISEHPEPVRLERPWKHGVEIRGLRFRYPGTEREVLSDIDLDIGPHETVALVGKNGSGKTTLVKLLCRLYDVDAGAIEIEKIDIRRLELARLRADIGVVYQDFGRYQLSARDNIWIGAPELRSDSEAIVAAAAQAGVHELLEGLEAGYDTILSRAFEGGRELSIGQWQRLALARAFVRQAQLIVLDEPTSALDAAAELEFFGQLQHLARGRSILLISHRFSTVRLADRIYVLEAGRIIEHGDHHGLIAAGGTYAELYSAQARHYQMEKAIPEPTA